MKVNDNSINYLSFFHDMENRIRPIVESQFGPIILITETSRPDANDLLDLIPTSEFAVCDFSLRDIERADKHKWGYQVGRLFNIDHHADDPDFERPVSSGNLAAEFVRENGIMNQVVVNHSDCDSIISAGIVSGLLEPKPEYEAAVIAADHTGSDNDIADLLQAVQDERDIAFSFYCLQRFESGQSLPEKAQMLLDERREKRFFAQNLVECAAVFVRRFAHIYAKESVESELVAPFVKGAWVVAVAFKQIHNSKLTELKIRLTPEAPPELTLFKLGLKDVDPAFGGRWNAGSNKRGGASLKNPDVLFEQLSRKVNEFEESWMLEKAIQIATVAHTGMKDKAGAPYILHPLRIMCQVRTPVEKTVAVLHDVVEDCPDWTFERLGAEGFSEDVLVPLRLVTKLKSDQLDDWDNYFAFIDRCADHPVAATVKLADLEDNMDLSRIANVTPKDRKRIRKYAIAHQRLRRGLRGEVPDLQPKISRADEMTESLIYHFTHKIDVDVRKTDNGLVEMSTKLPVELKIGSQYRIRGACGSFPTLPNAFAKGAAVVMDFLPKGATLYVAVNAHGVPDGFKQATYNNDGVPSIRAVYSANDPLSYLVLPAKKSEVFVKVELNEDLYLEVPAGRNGRLNACKVFVPSLEQQYESLNQAYSAIAREFEPLRKSVSGNVFKRVFITLPLRDKQGAIRDQLVWLDYLRCRIELEALGKILNGCD